MCFEQLLSRRLKWDTQHSSHRIVSFRFIAVAFFLFFSFFVAFALCLSFQLGSSFSSDIYCSTCCKLRSMQWWRWVFSFFLFLDFDLLPHCQQKNTRTGKKQTEILKKNRRKEKFLHIPIIVYYRSGTAKNTYEQYQQCLNHFSSAFLCACRNQNNRNSRR